MVLFTYLLMYFGTLGVVYHMREKRFCDYNHDSLPSVLEAEGDLACLLTEDEINLTRYFSMCVAPFFYTETVEDRGVICSPKACRKYLFAALQGLNQSLLDSLQSIEFWCIFF